jgi:hypothetical protein
LLAGHGVSFTVEMAGPFVSINSGKNSLTGQWLTFAQQKNEQ